MGGRCPRGRDADPPSGGSNTPPEGVRKPLPGGPENPPRRGVFGTPRDGFRDPPYMGFQWVFDPPQGDFWTPQGPETPPREGVRNPPSGGRNRGSKGGVSGVSPDLVRRNREKWGQKVSKMSEGIIFPCHFRHPREQIR